MLTAVVVDIVHVDRRESFEDALLNVVVAVVVSRIVLSVEIAKERVGKPAETKQKSYAKVVFVGRALIAAVVALQRRFAVLRHSTVRVARHNNSFGADVRRVYLGL